MATTAAAAKTPPVEIASPEVAPKKKNKLVLIIAVLAVVLSAAAAGAWFFLFNEADDGDQPRVSSKPAVFLPVDQFTVNLQPEEGQQYLQVAMTLKVVDQAAADAIKVQMPEVRSRVLLLLSNKKPSQLVTLEGKNKLIQEIANEVEGSLPTDKSAKPVKKKNDAAEGKKAKGAKAKAKSQEAEAPQQSAPSRVVAVYFTHFIVQ